MKPQIKLWTIFSLILLSGCGGIKRPDSDLCVINVPGQTMKCYNLNHDYTSEGKLKSDAVPKYKPVLTLDDVNKLTCTDPDGLANLKVFIKEMSNYIRNCGDY